MTRRPHGFLLIAVMALAGSVAAQDGVVFRGGTDTVVLNVTATGPEGRLVGGLTEGDFQVLEDGVVQEVGIFSREPQPIALSLLLDTSTSMEDRMGIAQQAAIGFVKRLGTGDVAQIIDFDSRAILRQAFTNDRNLLETAILRTQAGGSTSLYNALAVGIDEQRRERQASEELTRRQAIVVLSDGEDTSSLYAYEDVLELSRRSWVTVYAIGLRAKDRSPRGGFQEAEFVLRTLSQDTGGRAFFVDDMQQLATVYQRIADELATQYTLGYTSKNAARNRAWREITVRVAQPGVLARTKAGYFAPGPAR